MSNGKRISLRTATILASIALLAGCSSNSGGNGDKTDPVPTVKPPDPVLLQISSQGVGTLIDDSFMQIVNDHLKKKYPHISINYNPEVKGSTLDDLIASGNTPDVVVTFNGRLSGYRDMDLVFDMTPLFQKTRADLGAFEPNYIQDVRNGSDKNELYGLPINVNYHAMYYNKDIFDKFGAPYPTDGMDWQSLLELARKVTRNEGGTQYRGLDPGSTIIWMSQPLSIATIAPDTDRATINTQQWKQVFELAKSIYDIPGNAYIAEAPKNQFMKSKTLAILLDLNILNQLADAEKDGLNWDIAQYPSYPEKRNIYGNASVYTMIATKSSKHPEDVARLIEVVTSEEVQLELSRMGKLSPLKSDRVKQALGENQPTLKGKRLPSIFKSLPVPYPVASQYRSKAESIAVKHFREYLKEAVDVNTALSRAEEEINLMVATEKGASK